MVKKHFRTFQNVVLTLYLAIFYQIRARRTSIIQEDTVRGPVPPKVERAGTDLFCLESKSTFRLVPFHILIPPGSGLNWALFWPYVIDAIWPQCQIKGYIELQVKVESAKNARIHRPVTAAVNV